MLLNNTLVAYRQNFMLFYKYKNNRQNTVEYRKLVHKLFSILLIAFSINVFSHEFIGENLMLSEIKIGMAIHKTDYPYARFVDEYMRLNKTDIWSKYRDNEFEFEEKKTESIALMKNIVDSFTLDEEFTINTTFELSKYNFKTESFPLSSLSKKSFFCYS